MKRTMPAIAATAALVAFCAVAEEPFPPVACRFSERAFEVEFWGRAYRYENSAFPVSVRTAGRELFNAPMSLHAKFGDADTPWNKRIELYLLKCGVTQEEIDRFRAIMLQ